MSAPPSRGLAAGTWKPVPCMPPPGHAAPPAHGPSCPPPPHPCSPSCPRPGQHLGRGSQPPAGGSWGSGKGCQLQGGGGGVGVHTPGSRPGAGLGAGRRGEVVPFRGTRGSSPTMGHIRFLPEPPFPTRAQGPGPAGGVTPQVTPSLPLPSPRGPTPALGLPCQRGAYRAGAGSQLSGRTAGKETPTDTLPALASRRTGCFPGPRSGWKGVNTSTSS